MEFLRQHERVLAVLGIAFLFVCAAAYGALAAPPAPFPSGSEFSIERGSSVSDIAEQLSGAGIVKSSSMLLFLLRASGASTRIQAGTYRFDAPQNAFAIARRLTAGAYGLLPVRITFPEGVTVREIALQAAEALPHLAAADIERAGEPHEGYLFPDTYDFPTDATVASVIETLRKNFDKKLAPHMNEVQTSGRPLSDIVTLASLVEKEGRSTEVRRTIAGILLNRLERGMLLQVDAVFGYIFKRETYSPSFADLKVDSPYNTYLYKGLPPGPINNPGLDSIEAVLNPTKTNYLFYLTDREGIMRYATTYAGHQSNERTYLK